MSRISDFTSGVCFFCGEPAERGGYWMGRSGSIHVCPDRSCIERLIHTAIDALDDRRPGEKRFLDIKDLLSMTEQVYWYKRATGIHRFERIKRNEKPDDPGAVGEP